MSLGKYTDKKAELADAQDWGMGGENVEWPIKMGKKFLFKVMESSKIRLWWWLFNYKYT